MWGWGGEKDRRKRQRERDQIKKEGEEGGEKTIQIEKPDKRKEIYMTIFCHLKGCIPEKAGREGCKEHSQRTRERTRDYPPPS